MNKKRLTVLLASICLVVMVVVPSSLTACGEPAGPVEIEAVTFWDVGSNEFAIYETFANAVSQRSDGTLTIKRVGGMEVVPIPEMASAVKEGVIDMVLVFPPAFAGEVPGADMAYYSEISRDEEHRRGVDAILNEEYEKGGLHLVGFVRSGLPEGLFYIFINKKIETPQELNGIKMAAEMEADPFMKALGLIAVNIPDPEVYTAMERGLVDSYYNPIARSVDLGLTEVSDYVIAHPFFHGGIACGMNLDAWNQLSGDQQEILTESFRAAESFWYSEIVGLHAGWWQEMLDDGVEVIEFSPADREYYLSRLYDAQWEFGFEQYPDLAAKISAVVRQ